MAVTRLGRIYEPSGRHFVPLGVNGVAAPGGPGPQGDFWVNGQTYMNGYSAEYVSDQPVFRGGRWRIGWGCNFLRINTGYGPDTAAGGYSEADILQGLWTCVDEYLARGIVVCASDHSYTADDVRPNGTRYSPPTYDQLMANTFFRTYLDGWIDRYSGNSNAWLYPLNEPYRGEPGDLVAWMATGTALYNYARGRGFTGIFVWDLPGWAQRLYTVNTAVDYRAPNGTIQTTNLLSAFLMDKVNVVFGWHMYDPGTISEMTDWATRCVELGIPVIVGEIGFGGSGAPQQGAALGNMSADDEIAWAWGAAGGNGGSSYLPLGFVSGFGFGFVAWAGSGNRNPGWSCMSTRGASMFENDLGATDPRNVTIRTSLGLTDTVQHLIDNAGYSLAEINFYLSNPAYGPWTVTSGSFPNVAAQLNPTGFALYELTSTWRGNFFGGGSLWSPVFGRGAAGGYGVRPAEPIPVWYIT